MTRNYSLSPEPLRVLAPAKINLHLEILGSRSDGFHELAMVMQSIDLKDEIEFRHIDGNQIILRCDDNTLSVGSDNLIIKAAKLMQREERLDGNGIEIYLKKRIPIGAGLAGGSSDAAAVLIGLNSFWDLHLQNNVLLDYAAILGSDVPFCVKGGTQLCFGRGEKLEPLDVDNSSMAIVLVKDPNVSVSTPLAYKTYKELNGSNYINSEAGFELRRQELRNASWLKFDRDTHFPLRNDLQKVVSPITPAVQNALNVLSELPEALSVAMSGSGPSCFALFSNLERARAARQDHLKSFSEFGLKSWCCSLRVDGAKIESD